MHTDDGGFEAREDTVGFVMELPESCHSNLEEFCRAVAVAGEIPELQICAAQGSVHSVSLLDSIVRCHVRMDVGDVILDIVVETYIMLYHM